MKRKVVEQGGTTLMVSIPVKWARKYGVGKGDELDLQERGKELILSTKAMPASSSIEIDVKSIGEQYMIGWILTALYREGYDEISIHYNSSKDLKYIQQIMKDLFIGFIVASQSERTCVLRCISQDLEMEFPTALRRAWLVSMEMADGVLARIKEGRFSELEDLMVLERTCDQLTNFCERILNKRGYSEYRKTYFMYTIVWNLERLVDCYKHLCRYLTDNKTPKVKLSDDVIEVFARTNRLLHRYYESFYKFDMNILGDLNKERGDIRKRIRELTESRKPKEVVVMGYLQNIAQRIMDFSISTVAINLK